MTTVRLLVIVNHSTVQHPATHTNRGGVRVTVLLRKVHALQDVIADAISFIVPVTMINAMVV